MRQISALVLLAVAGCGEEPPRAQPAQASAAIECLPVPTALISTIESTLTVRGGGTLRSARAVRSGSHRSAYFVSAEIDGPGMEGDGEIGTWFATNLSGGSGIILSVPHVATAFSRLGDASKTDADATLSDPGARESQRCVGQPR
jgi:hypothetical protein